jgi:hypothetical protein
MNKIDIVAAIIRLRDDIRAWVSTNLRALNSKIDKKTSFSGNYDDLSNAPNIYDEDSDNLYIADKFGNVIVKLDKDGLHTTAVTTGVSSAPHRGILVGVDEPTEDIGVDGDIYIMYADN